MLPGLSVVALGKAGFTSATKLAPAPKAALCHIYFDDEISPKPFIAIVVAFVRKGSIGNTGSFLGL